MATCGEALIRLLELYRIDTIFGIPGVHTVELYRGLGNSPIRHVTPRHEQGAGFMADGYARASGRPAACFIITGPGLTNIATALGITGDAKTQAPRWSTARRAQLRIALADGPWGRKPFIESVGCGLFAEAMPRHSQQARADAPNGRDEELTHAREFLADCARTARPASVRLSLDGADHTGDYLLVEGLVYRYDSALTDDGLPPGEGAFLACTFWLVDNYLLQGRHAEARELFDHLLGIRNDVGLLAEEYHPTLGRHVGNFPQAFSHVALVSTALNMQRSERRAAPRRSD